MKITKRNLIRIIKEQVNNNSDIEAAISKAADICRDEFENALDEQDFSDFGKLVSKNLGRPLTSAEKNNSEYKRLIKLTNDLVELKNQIAISLADYADLYENL